MTSRGRLVSNCFCPSDPTYRIRKIEQIETITRDCDGSQKSNLDVSIAEIRREYLKHPDEELIEINKLSKKLNLEIYYSVPEKIACAKRINSNIKVYFEEARQMGSTHIKFNIGDLENLDIYEMKKLRRQKGYFWC